MVRFRVINSTDSSFFLGLTGMMGWGLTQCDFNRIMKTSPGGGFIALEGKEKVGVVITVKYGNVGWIGNLVVKPGYRNKGIGSSLMFQAMNHLQEEGVKTIRMDAVQKAIPLYKRLNFKEEYWSLRHIGKARCRKTIYTRLMSDLDFPSVYLLDHAHFKANRRGILYHVYSQNPELCWTAWEEGELAGYIMGKEGPDHVRVGPWICDPGRPDLAEELLQSVMNVRNGEDLWVGTPEGNFEARRILKENGFESLPSSLRMCYGKCGSKENVKGVFGLGGPEKG